MVHAGLVDASIFIPLIFLYGFPGTLLESVWLYTKTSVSIMEEGLDEKNHCNQSDFADAPGLRSDRPAERGESLRQC